MNLFQKWLYTPAKWYEYWMPQSGIAGGLLIAILVFCLLIVIKK